MNDDGMKYRRSSSDNTNNRWMRWLLCGNERRKAERAKAGWKQQLSIISPMCKMHIGLMNSTQPLCFSRWSWIMIKMYLVMVGFLEGGEGVELVVWDQKAELEDENGDKYFSLASFRKLPYPINYVQYLLHRILRFKPNQFGMASLLVTRCLNVLLGKEGMAFGLGVFHSLLSLFSNEKCSTWGYVS